MLTDEQIEQYNTTLDETKSKQDELKSEHEDTRKNIADLQAKIKSNLDANEKLQVEINGLQRKLVDIASQHNPLNVTINDIEERLANDAWEKQLKEMVDKQPEFYTVVERELEKIQNELAESVGDFVEFVAPATACKTIRTAIERGGFSQSLVVLRNGLDNYNRAIKDLCERKLRGQPIDLAQGALPVDRVKDWLRTREVIVYWKQS